MKITSLEVQSFRGLSRARVSLEPRVFVTGAPASGKSRFLQAIAAPMTRATRKLRYQEEMIATGLRMPEAARGASVSMEVAFDTQEIATTRELMERYNAQRRDADPSGQKPGSFERVSLTMRGPTVRSEEGLSAHLQFAGRFAIKVLIKGDATLRDRFRDVGDVFLFEYGSGFGKELCDVRQIVSSWYRRSPEELGDVMGQMEQVFPGIEFHELSWAHNGDEGNEARLTFRREGTTYELEEMSLGEKYVFVTLVMIQKLQVFRSVVLLDDLDGHLDDDAVVAFWHVLEDVLNDSQIIATAKYVPEGLPGQTIEL